MGFAAAAVGGVSGLNGDENCGECYELEWTAREFSYGGGAHPSIVGKRHVIQVTNIGYDVTGQHSFDLQIPGAGQGIFASGCTQQFAGYDADDFDCGQRYGGCDDLDGCDRLPPALRDGCAWRYLLGVYGWKINNGKSDNPFVRFRRVRCPDELVALSLSRPLDDDDYPRHDATIAPTRSWSPDANDDKVSKRSLRDWTVATIVLAVIALVLCLCCFGRWWNVHYDEANVRARRRRKELELAEKEIDGPQR